MVNRWTRAPADDGHGDARPRRSRGDRVVDEVVEDLLDAAGDGADEDGAVRGREVQRDVDDVGDGRPGVHAVGGKSHEVDGLRRGGLFGARELEEIADEAGQPVRLVDGGGEIVRVVAAWPRRSAGSRGEAGER